MLFPKIRGEVTEIYFPPQPSKQTLSQTGPSATLLERWHCSSSFTLMALDEPSNSQQMKSSTKQP